MDYTGRIITKNPQTPSANGAPGVWTLDEAMQYSKQGKWPPGYQISRSVRLRSSAGGYFNRTPTTTSNRTTWTWSGWIKRGVFAADVQYVFALLQPAVINEGCRITASNTLDFYLGGTSTAQLITTQVFRDPSAWYHLVVAVDTTQATSSDRIKIYINGSQVTAFTTANYPTQNYATGWNTTYPQYIGYQQSGWYLDCYLTEINFIDGQALTPASFGYFDTYTGVWQPAPYTGTYGTNGFYLTFADNSAATAAAIGKDYSGNGNNWTPNNISVTAGTTYDSMVDVPINWGTDTGAGGVVRGNYATLNPLANGTAAYVKAGNLQINPSDGNFQPSLSTIGVSSGKWYAECTVTNVGTGFVVGIDKLPSALVATQQLGQTSTSWGWYGDGTNTRLYNNGSYTSYGTTYTTGAVISIVLDMDAGTLVFYRNGVSQGTATTGLSGTYAIGASPAGAAGIADMNYGQRPFVYTAPSGYKALCTQNISVPTVLNGANYMTATIWTGTGANPRTFTGLAFKPDLIWNKSRSNVGYGALWDSIRGGTKALQTYSTNDENNIGDAGGSITSFNSDGATFANGSVNDSWFNSSAVTYVNWQWKGNGTAVTNTNGTITSSVSASTTAGFSVVTYTGNGTSGATIGHGLGATASFIILKRRDGGVGYSWYVQHPTLGPTKALFLDSTNGAATSANYWNNTAPTSTVFSVGNDTSLNANAGTYVAYCWSQITGYSAFTTYTGNGSGDGPFVYCGFRPRWLMIKRYDAAGDPWWLVDSTRSPYNQTTLALRPNSSNAEDNGGNANFDFLANGFKARTSGGGNGNESGATYIVAAFAENPFTIARAR